MTVMKCRHQLKFRWRVSAEILQFRQTVFRFLAFQDNKKNVYNVGINLGFVGENFTVVLSLREFCSFARRNFVNFVNFVSGNIAVLTAGIHQVDYRVQTCAQIPKPISR